MKRSRCLGHKGPAHSAVSQSNHGRHQSHFTSSLPGGLYSLRCRLAWKYAFSSLLLLASLLDPRWSLRPDFKPPPFGLSVQAESPLTSGNLAGKSPLGRVH